MSAGALEVRPLSAETRADFEALRRQPSCDWCHCAAWHHPTWEDWGGRTAEENAALRRKLFEEEKYDGYLLYETGRPIGWAQCAPLALFPKMIKQFGLEGEPEGTWAVGCLEILPEFRKRGLSYQLMRAVIEHLGILRVRRLLAFPRRGTRPDGEAWTGPESLFESLGFVELKPAGERRVMKLGI